MELLSIKKSNQLKYGLPIAWIGLAVISLATTNFHWLPLIMLVVGILFFTYALVKTKEIYDCGDTIKIKSGNHFIEIPLSEIDGKVELSSIIQGFYRINFKADTEVGKHVVFQPRIQYLFFKHKAVKSFIRRVNT